MDKIRRQLNFGAALVALATNLCRLSQRTAVKLNPNCKADQRAFVRTRTVFACMRTCSDSSNPKYRSSCQQSSEVFMAVKEQSGSCFHCGERLQCACPSLWTFLSFFGVNVCVYNQLMDFF